MMILAGVAATVYALNRLLLIQIMPEVDFLKKYLSDVMALPVYLPVSLYLAWRLHLVPEDYKLQFTHILGAVIIFGFLFEGVVPVFDATTTRDPFDILAYLAGGLVVYIVGSMGRQKRISTQQD